jgi:acyl carrier protein
VTNDIEATVVRYLQENYLPQSGERRIDPRENLFDSGILDSAAVLSVILFIEQEFAITIPDEDLLPENVASVEAAVAYVTRRLNGGRSGAEKGEVRHDVSEEVRGLGPR